jgi:putative ABC transport system substrate-binding protein
MTHMKRRDFITILGSAAAALPLAAHAQQSGQMRRIGVLVNVAQDDPQNAVRLPAFRQTLERLGWSEGRNVRIDYRFSPNSVEQARAYAKELIALKPDVVVAATPRNAAALQRESRATPLVFLIVSDPVAEGLVASLARPGGSATGFLLFEASIAGKWLAMLKEIEPRLARAALMGNPKVSAFDYWLRSAEALAPSLAVEIVPSRVEGADDIERVIDSLARLPNSGLVLPPDSTTPLYSDRVIRLAAQHRIPAVYSSRYWVTAGGLMSYDTNRVEQFRQVASYVDRILRGEKPADLPVQAPVKYETVINLKTAKALGLTVPDLLLVRADEVIE